ncbi:MAG: DUF1232 domain-containing protein [Candidatus Woesearchaeota archaeon]
MEKTFIDYLRKDFQEVKNSNQEYSRELSHFPDLVKLLCDLLDNDILDKESRVLITSCLGYLLAPNDLLPEEVYGAYGYMDDMYLACLVLKDLNKKYRDLIKYLWTHEDTFDIVLDECFYTSEKILEEKNVKEKLLRYCGLSD